MVAPSASPISAESVVRAARDQVSAEVGGEAVLLGLERGNYYGLGGVGARVWALVRDPRSVEAIRDAITTEFAVGPDECLADLIPFLEHLRSEGLIETVPT